MKKSKILFACLMALLMVLPFVFSACSNDTEEEKRFKELDNLLSPSNPVEINIWHYYNNEKDTYFKELISQFNNTVGAEKGIFVNSETLSSPTVLYSNVVSALSGEVGAKPLPDIVQAYTDTAYAISQVTGLADIESYFRVSEINEFIESYLEEGRAAGSDKLEILPLAKSTEALVLNKKAWDAFAAADTTVSLDDLQTMEGLKEVSRKYYERYGKAFFGRDSFANYMIGGLKQLGYDIYDYGQEVTVCENKQAYRTLWNNMYEPYVRGWFAGGASGYRSNEMQSESIIAYVGSTSSANNIPVTIKGIPGVPVTGEAEYDNEVLMLPLPYSGEKVNIQQGAGMCILKSSQKKEYASAVFLKWFTGDDINLKFSLFTGYLPVKKSVADFESISATDEYTSASKNVQIMLEATCEMLEDYSLYYVKGFKNGNDIRDNVLSSKNYSETSGFKDSMQYQILKDADAIKNGTATLASCLSDANFEDWYARFISAVKNYL